MVNVNCLYCCFNVETTPDCQIIDPKVTGIVSFFTPLTRGGGQIRKFSDILQKPKCHIHLLFVAIEEILSD